MSDKLNETSHYIFMIHDNVYTRLSYFCICMKCGGFFWRGRDENIRGNLCPFHGHSYIHWHDRLVRNRQLLPVEEYVEFIRGNGI